MEGEHPAGWYPSPDPARRERYARYWNGTAWTDHEVLIETAFAAVASTAPTPTPTQTPTPAPGRDGRGASRLLSRLAVLLLVVAVVLPLVVVGLDRADASGPVLFTLQDETRWNTLINPPELMVTSGATTDRRPMTVLDPGAFLRLPDLSWSLDEPLRVALVPAYASEASETVELDLRENGARRLGQGWGVRIRVVATDTAFEVEISQPVVSGFNRSREVVHRSSIPRSNERRIVAAIEAREARWDACVAEESALRIDAVAPVLELAAAYESALDEHRIYGTGSVNLGEYANRVTRLTASMDRHLRAAEQSLDQLPDGVRRSEFVGAITTYATLRSAWQGLDGALRNEWPGPGPTIFESYPQHGDAIVAGQEDLRVTMNALAASAEREIGRAVRALCTDRYPATH